MFRRKTIRSVLLLCLKLMLFMPMISSAQTVSGFSAASDFLQIKLNWDHYTAGIVTNYEIYWDTVPGIDLTSNLIATADKNVNYTHSGLTVGKTYYYKIRAMISGGMYSVLSDEISATPLSITNLFKGDSADGNSTYRSCNIDLDGNAFSIYPLGLTAAASTEMNILYWDYLTDAVSYTIRWSTDSTFATYTDETGLTSVFWLHSGLTAGIPYYYKITGVLGGSCPTIFSPKVASTPASQAAFTGGDGDGHSNNTSCLEDLDGNLTTQTPSNLFVVATQGATVLYWDQLEGAVSYTVRWSNDPTFGTFTDITGITNLNYYHSGLTPGIKYYYKVTVDVGGTCPTGFTPSDSAVPTPQAYISGGNGDGHSNSASCDIYLDGTSAVSGPSGFYVAASLYSNVMYWDQYSGATSYTVRYSTDPTFATFTDQTGIVPNYWVHTGIVPGTTYYYKVTPFLGGTCPAGYSTVDTATSVSQAHITGGNGDGHSNNESCTIDLDGNLITPAPANLIVAASLKENRLYWDALTGAITYTVRWSTDPAFGTYTDVTGLTTISYSHTGITPGTTYYYKVTADLGGICPVGYSNIESAIPVVMTHITGEDGDGHSNFKSCTIDLDGGSVILIPNNLTVAASHETNMVYWDYMEDATSYTLRWSTDPYFGSYTDISGLPLTYYQHTSLTPGTDYYYKITAVVGSGCPTAYSDSVYADPVSMSFITGATADGHASSASCFTMPLYGIDPTITPPDTVAICPFDSVLLTSSIADTFQWMRNGVDIPGEISQTYMATQNGSYVIKITNVNGCRAISFPTVVTTIDPQITINSDPTNDTICNTGSGGFSISASGNSLSYQWQLSTNGGSNWSDQADGGVYSNMTTDAMTITGAVPGMNGYQYRCYIYNACGDTFSAAATLYVIDPPSIATDPTNSSICAGNTTSFDVSASGAGPYNYQWQLSTNGGSLWNDQGDGGVYSGMTNDTMTITGATAGMNNYQYRCILSSACGNDTSNAATLTISPDNTWLGYTTNWDDSNNWSCGLPDSSTNALIPTTPVGGDYPVVNSTGTSICHTLTIETSATVTINNDKNLSIYGNWANNGSLAATTGTVIFKGNEAQTIQGTAATDFGKLTIDKNSDAVTLNIANTAIADSFYIKKGIFNAANQIMYAAGNWVVADSFAYGTSTVVFNGNSIQKIQMGGNAFYNATFNNNTAGNADIELNDSVIIVHGTTFTNGIVYFNGTGALTYLNGASSNQGDTASFVDGIITKIGMNEFTFPVGDVVNPDYIWAPIKIESNVTGSIFTAQYFFTASPDCNDTAYMCTGIHHTSAVEYWELTSTNAYPDVTIYFKDSSRSFINDLGTLALVHRETCNGSDRWADKGGTGFMDGVYSGYITGSGFSSYSPITFGSRDSSTNPLPVGMYWFEAECDFSGVRIEWKTSSETNNDYFTVEKSTDMNYWEVVATIKGAGNSSGNNYYDFTDINSFKGAGYYRLKQTDIDGKISTFNPVVVECNNTTNDPNVVFFPNPFDNDLLIMYDNIKIGQVKITVYDMLGNIVSDNQLYNPGKEANYYRIDLSKLASGMYTIQFTTSDFSKVGKITKNKH